MIIREPDKCQKQTLTVGQLRHQQVFMLAESLTNLSLRTIAVYSMMETFLRYTDQ